LTVFTGMSVKQHKGLQAGRLKQYNPNVKGARYEKAYRLNNFRGICKRSRSGLRINYPSPPAAEQPKHEKKRCYGADCD